jgi:ribonuclease T2
MKCPGVTPSWSYFTLHGLWPENADGTYPQTCSNAQFDPAQVAPIQASLDKYWVSLNGPSETFWAHEYEKHGTCATDVFPTELAFMNGTLALREAYDITPALATAGIVPSATATFSQAQFQAAVTKAFGYPALLSCDNNGNVNGAVVCVSKKGAAQSCGSVKYGTCSANALRLLPPRN